MTQKQPESDSNPQNWPILITAEELLTQRRIHGDGTHCIFDCRSSLADPGAGRRLYEGGHIPGAIHLDLEADLSGAKNGRNGRHPLPDPQAFAKRMGVCGVGPETQVFAYDDNGGVFAARLWWLLNSLGHTRVSVLDGGLQAWESAGGGLDQTAPHPQSRSLPVSDGQLAIDVDQLEDHEFRARHLLVDARSADRFAGQNETLDPVAGHIPGASNRFFGLNLKADGLFKAADELKVEFLHLLGSQRPDQVVHYCGSGVTACHNLLAMEHAGLKGSRLYAGSWSEWCADPKRDVAV